MASTIVVGLAGQLALCPSGASAASCSPRAAARSSSGSRARLLLGARALPQLSSTPSAGFAQVSTRQFSVVAKASETQPDASEAASDLVKSAQEYWNKLDDKLAVGGLGFAGLIILWASFGLLSAIDKLPLLPGFFEFVGIAFSGWFTYRYLLFKPDREELLKLIDEAKGKITGQ
ncbi:unnamed protein product [Calypogeia fissa]